MLAAAACQVRTEVLFGVVTDLHAPDKIDNVTLIVSRSGTGVAELTTNWMISGNPDQVFNLPGSFGVTSDGGDLGIEADLIGTLGGNVIVERTALLTFVDGQTLFYRMGLTWRSCEAMGSNGCGDGMTCIEGVCRPQQADSSQFPTFDASLVDNLTCNSGTAYIDTDTGQPMTFSAGAADCPSNLCSEGTCYLPPPSGSHGGGSGSTPRRRSKQPRRRPEAGRRRRRRRRWQRLRRDDLADEHRPRQRHGEHDERAAAVRGPPTPGRCRLDVTSVTMTMPTNVFAIASGMTGAHTIPVDGSDPFEVTCTPKTTGTIQGTAVVELRVVDRTDCAGGDAELHRDVRRKRRAVTVR